MNNTLVAKVNVEDAKISFDTVYKSDWFPQEVSDIVKKANILIIPSNYTSNSNELIFPETTSDFLDYLQRTSEANITCDIAISEDNYRRIEKHSALIEIATVIVNSGILPIAINMISSYLYDLVSRYRRTPEDTTTKICIISEETSRKKTLKIEYEGPVSGVKNTLKHTVDSLFKNEKK